MAMFDHDDRGILTTLSCDAADVDLLPCSRSSTKKISMYIHGPSRLALAYVAALSSQSKECKKITNTIFLFVDILARS